MARLGLDGVRVQLVFPADNDGLPGASCCCHRRRRLGSVGVRHSCGTDVGHQRGIVQDESCAAARVRVAARHALCCYSVGKCGDITVSSRVSVSPCSRPPSSCDVATLRRALWGSGKEDARVIEWGFEPE